MLVLKVIAGWIALSIVAGPIIGAVCGSADRTRQETPK